MSDDQPDYFSLLGLPCDPEVDLITLKKSWYAQQKSLSQINQPSLIAHLNEAYKTLKDPIQRITYLFRQANELPSHQDDKTVPIDFLEKQFTWQEIIHTPARHDEWSQLFKEIEEAENQLRAKLFPNIREKDWPSARRHFLMWLFLMKTQKKLNELLDGHEK